MDARLCFEIKKGYAITFLFGTEDVVASWPKIGIPYSAELEEKVKALEQRSKTIGVNFAFQQQEERMH